VLLASSGPALAAGADAAKAKAAEHLRRGDAAAALEAAKEAVAADDSDVQAHVLYQNAVRSRGAAASLLVQYKTRNEKSPSDSNAFLLARLLRPEQAESTLKSGLKDHKDGYWCQVGMTEILIRQGKAKRALSMIAKSLEKRPEDAEALKRAGGQYAQARDYEGAEACFQKAMDADPSDRDARLGLAHSILRGGRTNEAASVLKPLKGGRSKPDPRVLLLDAAIATEKGDLVAAERALTSITVLDKNDLDAVLQLSMLRIRRKVEAAEAENKVVHGKMIQAEMQDLRRALAGMPQRADARYAMGYALEITGLRGDAIRAYQEAARIDPLNPEIYNSLGTAMLREGDSEAAVNAFRKALDRSPGDSATLFNLGYATYLLGDNTQAIKHLKAHLKTDKESARGWHALGLCEESDGKPKNAVASFGKAVKLDGSVAAFHRDLGEALYASRKFKNAYPVLQKAVEMDKKDVTSLSALARCCTSLRKYEEAVTNYELLIEIRPEDKNLRLVLAAMYHEFLKNPEGALIQYNKYLALGGDAWEVEGWIAECEAAIEKKAK
jgi:tetratricopeptide (TPR) repeat protein